jgi:hypothetical protein
MMPGLRINGPYTRLPEGDFFNSTPAQPQGAVAPVVTDICLQDPAAATLFSGFRLYSLADAAPIVPKRATRIFS